MLIKWCKLHVEYIGKQHVIGDGGGIVVDGAFTPLFNMTPHRLQLRIDKDWTSNSQYKHVVGLLMGELRDVYCNILENRIITASSCITSDFHKFRSLFQPSSFAELSAQRASFARHKKLIFLSTAHLKLLKTSEGHSIVNSLPGPTKLKSLFSYVYLCLTLTKWFLWTSGVATKLRYHRTLAMLLD